MSEYFRNKLAILISWFKEVPAGRLSVLVDFMDDFLEFDSLKLLLCLDGFDDLLFLHEIEES